MYKQYAVIIHTVRLNKYSVLLKNKIYSEGANSFPTELTPTEKGDKKNCRVAVLGPVVQSIFSLTSSLRGQLIKCFMTL